jgi:signal transduction histidine kinase
MGGLFLIIIAAMVRFTRWGYHHRSVEVTLIAGGVLMAIVLAANDYATVSGIAVRTRPYTLHLALVVLLLTIGAVLTIRFVRALTVSEQANEILATRLADRERELAAHYDRSRQIERREASIAERQRIMQDIHDGLGAQLVSSLMMVERGDARSADIAVLLRESLDEMRLAIDAFGETGIDLAGALAGLRYRMEPRLRAAGVALEWTMEDTFAALRLDEHAALQLLRIVQEVLANVMKHSNASRLSVRFDVEDGCFRLVVADNGAGFPVDRPRIGLGLSGIRKRARDLGGGAEIETSPNGTTVTVRCPVPGETAPGEAVR